MPIRVRVTGIDDVQRKLGKRAASDLVDALDLDLGVETRNMAIEAAANAPIETGALRASIRYSPKRDATMKWHFGSYLPYALRQEYEHIPRAGYMRRAYWSGIKETERTLSFTILKRLGG